MQPVPYMVAAPRANTPSEPPNPHQPECSKSCGLLKIGVANVGVNSPELPKATFSPLDPLHRLRLLSLLGYQMPLSSHR
jgi:hypothetical protein